MTCLYTAIKVHEQQALSTDMVVELKEEDVEKMEFTILEALEWRMNPPTAIFFVRQFLALLSEQQLSQEDRRKVLDLCKIQVEAALNDYNYVGVYDSTIAFAALSNALRQVGLQEENEEMLLCVISKAAKIKRDAKLLIKVQEKFMKILSIPQQRKASLCNSSTKMGVSVD
eukprot:CAMPEP_0116829580 /NCGR_PEP_ID=MMETSP0418-20121206/4295_1 /TAXON_ID=1158023 /ORGANISM="Astrosyne radiata, Strain 13vi08-1A" /LENGTH=170 /DNA_ID=CAMNT_0004458605 /DNA_START=18 /DNA_END=528 /DNA_ORIENTATION=+